MKLKRELLIKIEFEGEQDPRTGDTILKDLELDKAVYDMVECCLDSRKSTCHLKPKVSICSVLSFDGETNNG